MEDPSAAGTLTILAGLIGLLLMRAVAGALEAALVALGVPRATALAAAHEAAPRARALGALVAEPEATAFTIRVAATFGVLFAGLLAGLAGPALLPALPVGIARAAAALAAGLVSLPMAAAARGIGASHGEAVALGLAVPFRALRALLRPLARAVGFLAGREARFALPRPPLDEIERALAEYARAQGGPSEGTSELIHNVFEFRDKVARDVMVPRTEVVAVEIDTPVQEIIRVLSEEGHSRMPVYRGSLDQIAGVLHARDLVPLLANPELIIVRDVLRPAHFVPWSKPVQQLLSEMQRRHLHMAFVVDEFGGVMGICTIEDVLEQIVGEIQDEFEEDEDEGAAVEPHADGSFTVHGWAPVADFNQAARTEVPEDQGFETMAGFVSSLAGVIPARGDRFNWKGWVFTVTEADPRRVLKVRAARAKRA